MLTRASRNKTRWTALSIFEKGRSLEYMGYILRRRNRSNDCEKNAERCEELSESHNVGSSVVNERRQDTRLRRFEKVLLLSWGSKNERQWDLDERFLKKGAGRT